MSTYYVGNIACDSNYLAHYGVKGMEWGEHKKKKDYALDQANVDRRKAMSDKQYEALAYKNGEYNRQKHEATLAALRGETPQFSSKRNAVDKQKKKLATITGSSIKTANSITGNSNNETTKRYNRAVDIVTKEGLMDRNGYYTKKGDDADSERYDEPSGATKLDKKRLENYEKAEDDLQKVFGTTYNRKRVTQESKAADARKRAAAQKRKSHGAKSTY